MKANELTFGIEVECLIPSAHSADFTPGKYHDGIQVNHAPDGWNSQKDGSLVTCDGWMPCEVVSPILAGENGIAQVFFMAEYLQKVGAEFNKTTGLHVHVGAKHLTMYQRVKLAELFREHEAAFMGLNGKEAAFRMENIYCQLAPEWQNLVDYKVRRRSLNFVNLAGNKGTVEFRLFAGTGDPTILLTAVYMCVALVAKVSQMSEAEALTFTPFPRPVSMQEAAYNFIRNIWNRRTNLIIPDARAKDAYSVLLAQASKVGMATALDYKDLILEHY